MNSDDGATITIGGIKFPVALLDALRERRLVVFAGAGVSMGEPACLPNFEQLADMIAEGTGKRRRENESPDRFLDELSDDRVKVHALAKRILSKDDLKHTKLHEDILRIFNSADDVRIVTTNFDLLFEEARTSVFETPFNVYDSHTQPPGSDFNGIVHVHGSVKREDEMVLTYKDFGEAYLLEKSWATQFLSSLFEKYTILFVGYSHGDTILNYLARALPPTDQKRFALVPDESETEHWDWLKIDRIPYPASGDHKALHEGVQKLADFINWRPSNWKEKIERITEKSPDDLGDDQNLLQYALREKKNVEFFTDATESPKWLDWIDKQGYLDGMFEERSRDERIGLWAHWLVEKFAVSHADWLLYVIGRREGRLPAYFWTALANAVQSDDLNDEAFGKWMTLLLSRVPEEFNLGLELKILAEYCIQRNLMRSAFRIFETMLTANFDPTTREFKLVYEYDDSCMLWLNILRRQLDQCAEHTLGRLIQRLEDRHETLSRWKSASLHHDQSLWIMGLIANLDPVNNIYGFASLTLYAARDCLDWLIKERREDGAYWQRRLAKSESPLLRALAAHSVRMDTDLLPDKKAAWLLETNPLLEVKRINDWAPHQDLYKLAEQIYPRLNKEWRRAMIEAVGEYRFLRPDREPNEELDERDRYEWYHRLLRSDPECPLAEEAFKEAQNKRPEWRPRPDVGIQIIRGFPTRLTAEQLLEKSGSEWVPELPALFIQVSERHRINDSVKGLSEAVRKAAKQDFDWGLALADGLANMNEWETGAWLGLIEAWSHGENMAGTDLDKDRYKKVLKQIGNENLHGKEERDYFIIWTLNSLVVNGGAPYALELLSDTNRIAASLWDKIDEHDAERPAPQGGLVVDSRSASCLARYWLDGLSLLHRDLDSAPERLEQDWAEALSKIAQDHSPKGRAGRSALAQRFAFLLHVDKRWTEENLLPSFSSPNEEEFLETWQGFLTMWYPTKEAAEMLSKPSYEAVKRILPDNDNMLCNSFIDYYAYMVAAIVEDPLEKWIPEFFKRGSEENRRFFTQRLDNLIRRSYLPEQEDGLRDVWNRWIKRYWENRLHGVPKPLDNEEIKKMFSWPIYFGSAFPEAVDLAVQMEPTSAQEAGDARFLYRLSKTDLPSTSPKATAKLLLYLGNPPLSLGASMGLRSDWSEIIDNLLTCDLPADLKRDLEDLRATLS